MGQNPYQTQAAMSLIPYCRLCSSAPCICATSYIKNTIASTQYITSPSPSPNTLKCELKVWIHFCNEFVKRYENYIVIPDSTRPFDTVILDNPTKRIKFIDKFPMNEIEVVGLTIDEYDKINPTNNPLVTFPRSHLINFLLFQYWALGIEELPDILK